MSKALHHLDLRLVDLRFFALLVVLLLTTFVDVALLEELLRRGFLVEDFPKSLLTDFLLACLAPSKLARPRAVTDFLPLR